MAAGYIKSLGGLKTVGKPYSGEDLGFAVAPGHEDLVRLINEGVAKLKENGEYQKLFDKYFTDAQRTRRTHHCNHQNLATGLA